MKGIIYKVENKENGLIYIGATTHSMLQRKLDHVERANRNEENKFYDAISTHGVDAFRWEQIDSASSMDELAHKEQQYVLEYNSKEEGYNSSIGGEFKKTVYKFDLDNGRLLDTFDCLDDAASSINSTKQHISRACLSVNNIYGGYFWSYELKEPFCPFKDKRRKRVVQYSLDGEKIAEFISVADASRKTGSSKTCIARVCRGERRQSGGFVWKYN
ncbi:endonuclease [Seonamhaeicola sediminis]|uniref:Endonuclease n=1 Tax=Seonamhaeicola sediminis TaxID=2528206 RepID=A0A562YAP5_9FLAO|nr:NUMOD1 domain-containing DNA-binding protein [Seonamhaeicola sediminis]TWO31504.1 endonuclease [Seonamhaeicola sediminis]